jgi:hypothetical protein
MSHPCPTHPRFWACFRGFSDEKFSNCPNGTFFFQACCSEHATLQRVVKLPQMGLLKNGTLWDIPGHPGWKISVEDIANRFVVLHRLRAAGRIGAWVSDDVCSAFLTSSSLLTVMLHKSDPKLRRFTHGSVETSNNFRFLVLKALRAGAPIRATPSLWARSRKWAKKVAIIWP